MGANFRELLTTRAKSLADYGGARVVASFGDTAAEWAALDAGAGMLDFAQRRVLSACGSERASFLHGQTTNDIRNLAPGGGCAALVLNSQGRPLAQLAVYNEGERLLLAVDAASLAPAREALEKFLVADDVDFEEEPAPYTIAVAGPKAAATLAAAGLEGLASEPHWAIAAGRIADQAVGVLARGDLRVPCFEVLVPEDAGAAAVWQELEGRGATPAGVEAYEIVRVESGTAAYGVDIDESRVVMEGRLEWAIHFNKGCYVGQEVVERSVSRGRLNREIVLASLAGDAAAGDVRDGGGEAEIVTSVADSPRLGKIALVYVARELVEPGARFELCSSGAKVAATVLEWPRPARLAGR